MRLDDSYSLLFKIIPNTSLKFYKAELLKPEAFYWENQKWNNNNSGSHFDTNEILNTNLTGTQSAYEYIRIFYDYFF
jgi:hypothetical protein